MARRLSPVSRAARHSPCASRPAARNPAPTASFRAPGDCRVSVPEQRIVAEIRRVAAAGFKECALTGVHLGSYGRDLDPASSLLQLLRVIASHAPDDIRFRISSLEPMDCTPERGVARRRDRCLCAPLSSAAAARQRPDPGGDASALHVSAVCRARRQHSASAAQRLNRHRCHHRISWRDRCGLRGAGRLSRERADHARARLPLLGSSGHGRLDAAAESRGHRDQRTCAPDSRDLDPVERQVHRQRRSARCTAGCRSTTARWW